MINVFTQTKRDISSFTEVSPKNGCFSSPEKVLNPPATHYSSLKFDADDEHFSVKNDALHIDFANSDYLSSYSSSSRSFFTNDKVYSWSNSILSIATTPLLSLFKKNLLDKLWLKTKLICPEKARWSKKQTMLQVFTT